MAVLCEAEAATQGSQDLADRLQLPLFPAATAFQKSDCDFFLCYRDGCLKLLDRTSLTKGGWAVHIDPRPGEQNSWPAPKKGPLAQAIGRKTTSVIDATTGWAQDSLALFRMGYQVICIERSLIMAELIRDGLMRLSQKEWVRQLQLAVPQLVVADAIQALQSVVAKPDCVYLDPMFPPKRRKSALSKKSMTMLRELLGDDTDKQELFAAALGAAGKRVVVKSPDYAEPLGGPPDLSLHSKLLRFDVYFTR